MTAEQKKRLENFMAIFGIDPITVAEIFGEMMAIREQLSDLHARYDVLQDYLWTLNFEVDDRFHGSSSPKSVVLRPVLLEYAMVRKKHLRGCRQLATLQESYRFQPVYLYDLEVEQTRKYMNRQLTGFAKCCERMVSEKVAMLLSAYPKHFKFYLLTSPVARAGIWMSKINWDYVDEVRDRLKSLNVPDIKEEAS